MSKFSFPTISENHLSRKKSLCYGIDLGTTYSLIAAIDPAKVTKENLHSLPVQLMSIRQKGPFKSDTIISDIKLASIVGEYDGNVYVGNLLYDKKALFRYFVKDENILYHWKTDLGMDYEPFYLNAFSKKVDTPKKIASVILKVLKNSGAKIKDKLDQCIVTVPASFQAAQRNDVIDAMKMADIVEGSNKLIDEPNAAFLGFFNELTINEKREWSKLYDNKNILIVDFGGGTLDLSVLNLKFDERNGISIGNLGISRYNDLGGQDVDRLIAEKFLWPKLALQEGIEYSISTATVVSQIMPQLLVIGEQLKKNIVDKINLKPKSIFTDEEALKEVKANVADVEVDVGNKKVQFLDVTISAYEFKELFEKLFFGNFYDFEFVDKRSSTIGHSIQEILESCELSYSDIALVLPVGGSSYNSVMNHLIEQRLSSSKLLISSRPDLLVVQGAAVYSFYTHVAGLSLINPITSDELGFIVKGGVYKPLIDAGEALPVKRTITGLTLQNNDEQEIVVPICIKSSDHVVGEIRVDLEEYYPSSSNVELEVEVGLDKVFNIVMLVDGAEVAKGELENPYAIGKKTKEELVVAQLMGEVSTAVRNEDKSVERVKHRKLLWKLNDAKSFITGVEWADKYLQKFNAEDAAVHNLKNIMLCALGRKKEGLKSLEEAIKFSPNEPSWRYNYSLKLSDDKALEYLQALAPRILESLTIQLRMAVLEHKVNGNKESARDHVNQFAEFPSLYDDFDKEVLLPQVHKIVGAYYAFTEINGQDDDEGKYLETK